MEILSEIQLSYNVQKLGTIRSSEDGAEFLRQIWNQETLTIFESFKVLLLNNANEIIGFRTISTGGITSTVVDLRLILSLALSSLATSMILAHNHPSGNLSPSQADIKITDKIKAAGKLLDITVFDHIILTKDSYFSFAEDGIL